MQRFLMDFKVSTFFRKLIRRSASTQENLINIPWENVLEVAKA